MLLVILMYAISASTYVIGKELMTYSTPLFLAAVRTLLAGTAFLFYARWRNQSVDLKKYLWPSIYVGIFMFYASNTFKFWSLHHITSGRAALIATTEPLFAMLFAYLVCGEMMNGKRWLGISLCLSGALALLQTDAFALVGLGIPDLMLLLSVIASSYGAFYVRKLVVVHDMSFVLIFGLSMFTAGLMALGTSCFLENPLATFSSESIMPFIYLLGIMVLVSNIVGYTFYGNVMKSYSALLIASASLLRPFFVALFYGTVTMPLLMATSCIILGMAVLYGQEREQQKNVVM